MKKKKRNSSSGVLTIDFIFSFLVTWGMMMVFLLMAFTLMMSSVSQYIIFATNRAHISGHINEDEQIFMGVTKFERLAGSFGNILSSSTQSMFRVELENDFPDPKVAIGNQANQWKYGFRLNYTATVLQNSEFPIIGGPGGSGGDPNFGRATLKAYMYREPSTQECLNFNRARWDKILERYENLGNYINGPGPFGDAADNGC